MNAVQKLDPPEATPLAPRMAVTPMEMLASAIDKGMAVETIDKLVALAERWDRNTARKAFDEAIASAKAEIPPIIKNRHVGFDAKNGGKRTDYRHEDMAEIARTVDPILARYGLSYRFRATSNVNEPITVTCILSHRLGHSEETTLSGGRDESGNKNSLQGIGSTITYLQRYSLKAALGLSASNDDDGKAGDNGKAISVAEAANIRDIITAIGDDRVEPRLLTWLKVESIDAIPAARYDEAIERLKLVPPKGKQS